MSILDRSALEESPLADLHAIASELSIDGYRRLRRPELIAAILERQGGEPGDEADGGEPVRESGRKPARESGRRPARRSGRGAARETEREPADEPQREAAGEPQREAAGEAQREAAGEPGREPAGESEREPAGESEREPADTAELTGVVAEELHAHDTGATAARRRRGRRGGRGRGGGREDAGRQAEDEDREDEEAEREAAAREEGAREEEAREDGAREEAARAEGAREPEGAEQIIEGLVELLPNGSGFMRVNPPEPSEDDVYISAAQVKRCELVPGDRISGPRRPPRRSERFASLVRVDTINDRPASEVADSARFDDLPVTFPDDRFRLGSEDPTVKAIEFLTPFGRGSRVTVCGAAQAGKTEALRRLAGTLSGQEGVSLLLALTGVRPEEVPAWASGPVEPSAVVTLAASADAQAQAIERIVDQGRRLAARGGHAVVLIDTLDGVAVGAARKALAAARRIVDGGSLTMIATASKPFGGETTVISLDFRLTGAGRFPALDLGGSWTMHPEMLVGDAGAEAIVRTRAEALGG